jgi:hypothetical protein
MEMSSPIKAFLKLAQGRASIDERVQAFVPVFAEVVKQFNAAYSRKLLVRDSTELLPSHPRHVSSARARLGSLIEGVLCHILNTQLVHAGFAGSFAYNCVTEYPDLYLRDIDGRVLLRFEVKALHDESDEGSSRFDTWTKHLQLENDFLIVIGWKWTGLEDLFWPEIIIAESFSAVHIAQERDRGHRLRSGTFGANGEPFILAKKTKRASPDQGNYGKLMRIVHKDQIKKSKLHHDVIRFAALLNKLYPNSPKMRR